MIAAFVFTSYTNPDSAPMVRIRAMADTFELMGWDVELVPSSILATRRRSRAVEGWLGSFADHVDLVLVVGSDPRLCGGARRWCRHNGVPVVSDILDWYSIWDVSGFASKLLIAYQNIWFMRLQVRDLDGAIVPGRCLGGFCGVRRVPYIVMPAVLPEFDHVMSYDPPIGFSLTYAGNPGKRDEKTLENLRRLGSDPAFGHEIEIRIIGGEVCQRTGNLVEYGRLSRSRTIDIVRSSSFTVLQRPANRRFARSGFPSKVAESLLLGVPVITNLTSDLGDVIVDRKNGIVLGSESYDSLVEGVVRAVDWYDAGDVDPFYISRDAESRFTPRAYSERLSLFLRDVFSRFDGRTVR